MTDQNALRRNMTLDQFDNGYWYATELRDFARELGVPSANQLRKDELEAVLREFLSSGTLLTPSRRSKQKRAPKDSEIGLRLDLPVVNYTNNKVTKEFLFLEAKRIDPSFKLQSGTLYRLNRWRESRLESGASIRYQDVVEELVRLNRGERVPLRTAHGRYNNFVADYRAANPGKSHASAVEAWKELKALDVQKTYAEWMKAKKKR